MESGSLDDQKYLELRGLVEGVHPSHGTTSARRESDVKVAKLLDSYDIES